MNSMTTTRGQRRTAGDREAARRRGREKAEAALERLDAAVSDIIANDDSFREYLRCSARMHSYSWGNRLLIMLQRPDTRMVAGFQRWKELGRPVCKGSKGIVILAPMVSKFKVTEEVGITSDGEILTAEGGRKVLRGFRVAYVFAVEDTDGPPIGRPEVIVPDDDTDEARDLFARLLRAAEGYCSEVSVRTDDPALGGITDGKPGGYYKPSTRQIVVNGNGPAGRRCKVLCHELGHAVDDSIGRPEGDTYSDGEAVAEGAAFVVAAYYGMDTSSFTAPYIAGWAQDIARVRRLLERIAKVSDAIITAAETVSCSHCGWDGEHDRGGCEHCR